MNNKQTALFGIADRPYDRTECEQVLNFICNDCFGASAPRITAGTNGILIPIRLEERLNQYLWKKNILNSFMCLHKKGIGLEYSIKNSADILEYVKEQIGYVSSADEDKARRIRIAEAEAEAALALLELVKIGNEPKRGDVYTLPKKFEKPDAWLSASDKDRYDFYSVADVVSNGNIIVIDEQTYKSEWYSADEFKRAGFKFHHHQPDYGKVGGISGIERKNVEIHRRSKHGQMGEIDNFEERHALYLKLLNDSNYYDVMFNPENGGLKAVHYGHNFDKEKGHYEKEVMRYAYQNGYCVILENEQGKNIGENYTEGFWNEDVFELATCENANSNNNNIVNGLKHCASKDDTKTAILYFYKGVFIEADVDRAIRRYNGLKNTLTYYKAFTAIYIVDKWGNIYKMR